MKRLLVFAFVMVFPFAVSQEYPNRRPVIQSFTSSAKTLEICPFARGMSDKPEVTLIAKATDPNNDTLLYEYSSTEGKISGMGSTVVWHLDGLPRGPHEIRVRVYDGHGGKAAAVLTVTTVDAAICDPPPPACPVIKVSCPVEMDHSQSIKFSAVIEGDAKDASTTFFKWTLNAGKILKGQNTREIEVTIQGAVGFDTITATVEVGGVEPSCVVTASGTTKIIW